MPKFNKGDRIVTKSGVHGTVLTVLDGNYYAVQFDGRELSKVHESVMKAENSCALNSKFKVGDKVTDGDAVYLITGVTGLDYIWKCISGTPNPHWSKGGEKEWAEEQVEIVNSCVKNAEAKDSKGNILKDGDYAVATVGPLKGKRVEIISVHSRANIYVQDDTGAIKIIDGAYLVKNDAPRGLTSSSKFRLKEDFHDAEGSYKKGSVFPMYAYGGISPKYGTMVVPGRVSTLQIPWEKLEVVNAGYPVAVWIEKRGDFKWTVCDDASGVVIKDFRNLNEAKDFALRNGWKVVRVLNSSVAANSTREIVQKALNRKATNADAVPTYIGNGVYKVGDIVNYNGSAWEVVSKSQLGVGNGLAKIAYGLKSTKTGVIVKGVPEHNISPKNTLVVKNTQGDALSSATYAIGKAMNYLRDSVQSLNAYFQYSLREGASEKDIATDKQLRTEVKRVRSQLIAEISSITALEKTVSKLQGIADGAGF